MLFSSSRPISRPLRPYTSAARSLLPPGILARLGLDPVVRRAPWALAPADVVMIVLNAVAHDNRVLKCASTLTEAGYRVTLLGKSGAWDCPDAVATRVLGLPTILLPDPHIFLRAARTRVPALNWDFMAAYMKSAMWHYVRAIGPRFLHTHDMNTIAVGADLARRLRTEGREVAWIHDQHEYVAGHVFRDYTSPDGREDLEWKAVALQHERDNVHAPDALVTVSPLLADYLQRDYGLAEPPSVILNAPQRAAAMAAMGRQTIRQMLAMGPEVPLLIYSGGVSRLRGLHTLIDALAKLPEVHLAIQTENRGSYVDKLLETARQRGYGNRLHMVPYVAPNEVPGFIRDATIGVHPMTVYGNSEVALPNKLFDYCLARLPCVVSDCRAMAEFVTRWGVGEVFRAEDPADLARAIRTIITNRAHYVRRMEDQPELLEVHSWEAQEEVLLEIYRRLGSS